MTTDFRALCAELIASWDADGCDWKPQHQARWEATVARARAALAALADGPAVPDGREPASVTGQPSDETWDALVERAWDKYQTVGYQGERFMYDRDFDNALEFVRQGLTRWGTSNLAETRSSLGGMPTPVPADKGEVGELVRWLRSRAGIPASPDFPAVAAMLTRAADLLEQRHPAPVPVSERLPGPEDCLAEGWAWFYSP